MGANRVEALPHLVDMFVSSTEPTVRDNGDALETDDVWLDLSGGTKVWQIYDGADWQTMGSGSDADAIHDNVAGEIAALTLVTAASGDHVLVEDASDSNAKKRVAASDFLGGGGGGTTWGDPVPSGNAPGGADDDEFADSSFDTGVWTVVDPASPTIAGAITEDADVLSVLHPGGDAAQEFHGIMQSVGSLTPPVTVETAMRWIGANQNYVMAGVGFSSGVTHGTDDVLMAGISQPASTAIPNWFHRRFDGFNSFISGDDQFYSGMLPSVMPWVHVRHTWVSSNTFRAEFSPDGISWINPAGADHSVTLTPTHMGMVLSTYGGSLPKVFTYEYFRVY